MQIAKGFRIRPQPIYYAAITATEGDFVDTEASLDQFKAAKLKAVFHKFDLDHSGLIGVNELMFLGKARRNLSHHGKWDRKKNERLIRTMDLNKDRKIQEAEFINHFRKILPHSKAGCELTIKGFNAAAKVAQGLFAAAESTKAAAKATNKAANKAANKEGYSGGKGGGDSGYSRGPSKRRQVRL